jgi:hypothetical protein
MKCPRQMYKQQALKPIEYIKTCTVDALHVAAALSAYCCTGMLQWLYVSKSFRSLLVQCTSSSALVNRFVHSFEHGLQA